MAELSIEPLRVRRVATAELFTEGPVPDGNGGILFSDIDAEKIFRYDIVSGETTVAYENSGGANGLMLDNEGRLLAAEGFAQRLTRREGETYEILASEWNEQRLNSPNDIAVDAKGGIYFTDPDYYHRVQGEGVYYIDPAGEINQVLLPSDRPNGIALSPDESRLYVAIPTRSPSWTNPNMEIRQYDLESPGHPTNERVFVPSTFVDGMHVDRFGNVYGATYTGFQIWDGSGRQLKNSSSPSETTNLTLEDPFGAYPNVLYITGGKYLYRVEITPKLAGDFDANGKLEPADIDTLTTAIHVSNRNLGFDLNANGEVETNDRATWVHDLAKTHFGDADLDGHFDANDLVQVLQANQYEDVVNKNSVWSTGDWDGDGEFTKDDLILALQEGGFDNRQLPAAVSGTPIPEPSSALLAMVAIITCCSIRPRRQGEVALVRPDPSNGQHVLVPRRRHRQY